MVYPSSEVGQMPADIKRLLDTIIGGIMALAAAATNSNSDFGARRRLHSGLALAAPICRLLTETPPSSTTTRTLFPRLGLT
jgi:hypothetical protein